MTKEDLIAVSLSDEQANKVLSLVDKDFVEKAKFNEINEENKTLKQSITERDQQLETLKKSSGDNAELKKQIETLQQQNIEQKKAHDAEMAALKLDNAVETALTAAGAKNVKAVRSLFDANKLKLSADGSVEGLKEQIAAVQKSDPYMFTEKQQKPQTFKGFQPGASSDLNPGTVDTSKMTYSEFIAYQAANPDAKY